MALVVPNCGEIKIAAWALDSQDLTLKLYTNDYSPVATTTTANFTEATFTGYSAKTLSKTSWNTPTTDANGKALIVYSDAQSWTAGSTQTIYGYYVVSANDNTLIWAEKFGVARSIASGDTLTITPQITCSSEN